MRLLKNVIHFTTKSNDKKKLDVSMTQGCHEDFKLPGKYNK